MAAVRYLDTVNGTRECERFVAAWNRFVANKPNWDLECQVEAFAQTMEVIARLRG